MGQARGDLGPPDWLREAPVEAGSEGSQPSERAFGLIFELFKDILISLPARECLTIEQNATNMADGQLCFVDWSQARIIADNAGTPSKPMAGRNLRADQLEAATLYLDESSFTRNQARSGNQMSGQMIEQSESSQSLVGDLLRRLAASNGKSNNLTSGAGNDSRVGPVSDESEQQLTRLTYLSSGSLLSLLGILTNLLILLIIFINTKQKCHNILGRGQTSHTNYHQLLLFQLTLTGLLLGGYILIDNINLYNGLSGTPQDNNLEAHIFSPLSIYLPPTPFKAAATEPFGQPTKAQGRNDEDLLLAPQQSTSEISAFLIYLDANRRPQRGRTRSRFHHAPPASLILISCTPSSSHGSQGQIEGSSGDEWDKQADSGQAREMVNSMNMLFNTLATIHLWTVVALAYDRYSAIAHPLEYLRSINETKARTFLLLLWCGSLILNVLLPLALSGTPAPHSSCLGPDESIARFEIAPDLLERNLHVRPAREQYFCSTRTLAPDIDTNKDAGLLQYVQYLTALSLAHPHADLSSPPQHQEYMAIGLSLLTFLLAILLPLVIVTVCNMSIYGIVKVHERRMSVSSSNQGYLGIGALGSSASCTLSHGRCTKRDSLLTNNTELANERSETCSIASSILGKLIRASVQVGLMGGILVGANKEQDSSSQCSSGNEHEVCRLISSTNNDKSADMAPQSGSSSACKSALRSFYLPHSDSFETKLEPRFSPASSIVSRLTRRRRRLVSLRRHQQQQQQQQQQSDAFQDNPDAAISGTASRLLTREPILKKKLKRKLSDKEQVSSQSRACSRKSSLAPSEQTLVMQEASGPPTGAGDNCSCYSNQSSTRQLQQRQLQQQQLQADSDGIMRQLKMAGLSFAGIAINELMASPAGHARTLHRSSSWSLGNMHSASGSGNRQQQAQAASAPHGGPTQLAGPEASQSCQASARCVSTNKQSAPMEPAAGEPVREKRHSYVSLMLSQQQRDIWQEKFCTKLLFDSDSESHCHQSQTSCSRNSQQQQQQQYFNLGGTKSVAFNVVVWLILLMLTFTLPQYSIITIGQILQASRRASSASSDRLGANLALFSELPGEHTRYSMDSNGDKRVRAATADFFHWLRTTSIWSDCICRLMFLLMLPLNGWLYGIRSRSLRNTFKMVLKRYISKKQASIEINQRRKSVASTRSRESSVCCNISALHQGSFCSPARAQNCTPAPMNKQRQQQQPLQQNEFPNGRVFRRCSSFNLPPQSRQDYYNSINEADEREWAAHQEQQARRLQNSSIRFVLHDGDQHEPARAPVEPDCGARASAWAGLSSRLLPIPSLMANHFSSSQTSSLDSNSLASSHGSLLSASIQSSQSAALLLLDQRNVAAEKEQPAQNQPLASRPTKLAGFLKKSGAVQMSRQQSYDSSTSRSSPSSLNGVLKKSSASTKSILHQHPHHPAPALNVSFGRTQSLDRDNSFDCAPDSRRRTGAHSLSPTSVVPVAGRHHRLRKSGATAAPPPPVPVNSLERGASKEAQEDDAERGPKVVCERQSASRRPSSDIKLLLTSAGEQGVTKLLLDTNEQQMGTEPARTEEGARRGTATESRPDEAHAEAEALNILKDADRQLDQILLGQNPREQIGLKLDYYKQLKTAISSYFSTLKRRRMTATNTADERRWKLMRQHSDTTNSRQTSTESTSSSCLSNQAGSSGDQGEPSSCDSPSGRVCEPSMAHASTRSRRSSLDSNSHKLAMLQRQEAESMLIEDSRGSSSQALNRSSSSLSISSNGSTKSKQLRQQLLQPPQSSHLKPPNFLKLILESESQAVTLYSSSLALSPIKECSSNHSWASSQSSLTMSSNSNGLQRKSSAASGNESMAKSLVEL